ncbi:unnamed protein product [Cercopithifilaria johnstoni]|uniref:Uncharacterized protein n=1 Tax=Cercopithifilaria johnstoni TaxID=2874296 RepID=A0A8J2LW35_9BILA|nr:unnamed protein product [Cercopithifilaria johnstoni]
MPVKEKPERGYRKLYEAQTVQTEPLDLSIRKVSEERIQLQNSLINETNEGQTESFPQSSHLSAHKKTHTSEKSHQLHDIREKVPFSHSI